jgi:DNA-binding PadR family transcriptional regulator
VYRLLENLEQDLLIRTEETKARGNIECFYLAQDEGKSAMRKYEGEKRVVKEWM